MSTLQHAGLQSADCVSCRVCVCPSGQCGVARGRPGSRGVGRGRPAPVSLPTTYLNPRARPHRTAVIRAGTYHLQQEEERACSASPRRRAPPAPALPPPSLFGNLFAIAKKMSLTFMAVLALVSMKRSPFSSA